MPNISKITSITTARGTFKLSEGERWVETEKFIEKWDEFKRLKEFKKSTILKIETGAGSEVYPFAVKKFARPLIETVGRPLGISELMPI